jgi:flotillin
VDRITIISDGHNGMGSQMTGEVARMVAQVPALMESITGMSIPDLIARLQEIQSSPSNGSQTRLPHNGSNKPA